MVCKENRNNTDNVVYNKVTNFGTKRNVEDIQKLLKYISVAIDKIQEKNCTHFGSTGKRPYGRKTG